MKKVLILKLLFLFIALAVFCFIYGAVIPFVLTVIHYKTFGFSMEYIETIFRLYQIPFICILVFQAWKKLLIPMWHEIQENQKVT